MFSTLRAIAVKLPRILAIAAAFSLLAQANASSENDTAVMARTRIKHIFVIYQENHSFDNYFGTYPGAENLASPLAQTHGFRQYDSIGKSYVTPFRITDPDIAGPSQSRTVIEAKMNGGAMDSFVSTQERVSGKKFGPSGARDVGLLTMAHYDCDTIPFLWKYAHAFALYDRIFSGMAGPSTPSALELIAGQAGQTQWARDAKSAGGTEAAAGVPVYNDLNPAYGPYAPDEEDKGLQIPQRYATLMLALAGTDTAKATNETAGVAKDLGAVAATGRAPIPWGWYQEGYVSPSAALPGYETHHNAPQYFAYLRQNDVFWKNEHEVHAMLGALANGTLPQSGIFYIKGGSQNHFGWKPANPDPAVQAAYKGDDDHPGEGDSDAQVGEAFVATFVNAIARSKYWNDSAIVITWDDPGGFYDHVPPPQFERCSDGRPCGDGPRLPFILISPYARTGAIVHDAGNQSSVVKLAEALFDLPSLASLPDEKPYLPQGPSDADPNVTDLLGGLDPARLAGTSSPISAQAAEIDDAVVNTTPPAMNCATLGITPVNLPGASATLPSNFSTRPARAGTQP